MTNYLYGTDTQARLKKMIEDAVAQGKNPGYIADGDGVIYTVKQGRNEYRDINLIKAVKTQDELDALLKTAPFKGQKKPLTASGLAYKDFVNRACGGFGGFAARFPVLEGIADETTGEDLYEELRGSYIGGYNGWCVVGHRGLYKGVTVYDVNSLYPWASMTPGLPWGAPVEYGLGCPNWTPGVYYFLSVGVCDMETRGGCPAWLNPRHNWSILTLTQDDYRLFKEAFRANRLVYNYVGFRTADDLFEDFTPYWYEKKQTSTGAERDIAKMILNGFIGRLARKHDYTGTRCVKTAEGVRWERYTEHKAKAGDYIPLASAILARARGKIVRDLIQNSDSVIYSDTDSLHSLRPLDLPISDKLGDYKIEHKFSEVLYMSRRHYIGIEDGHAVAHIGGLLADNQRDLEARIDAGEITLQGLMSTDREPITYMQNNGVIMI